MKQLSEDDYKNCIKLTNLYAPKILPPNYCSIPGPLEGQLAFQDTSGLLVIFTADRLWGDGKTWLHVSMSRQLRLPSYQDMTTVKNIFIGKTRQALQIFAREDRHVNIHPYCLHLWCAVEGDSLPDFGKAGTI